jgi:hypothetical protein
MKIMNDVLYQMFDKLAIAASMELEGREGSKAKTLTSKEIQMALRTMLSGEYLRLAEEAGKKALDQAGLSM